MQQIFFEGSCPGTTNNVIEFLPVDERMSTRWPQSLHVLGCVQVARWLTSSKLEKVTKSFMLMNILAFAIANLTLGNKIM